MKAVLLAGGLGTRISEESALKPKPMIEIGGRPILWHIMKIYSAHGIHDFIICLGYRGYLIKEYFANYFLHMSDVSFDMSNNRMEVHQNHAEPWCVTLVDTGENSMTGGRLRRVRQYLDDDNFCFSYGDGVADVNVRVLIDFHRTHGRLATVTAVQPPGRYGVLRLAEDRAVTGFLEKPEGDGGWINGGFFVLSPRVLDYIAGDDTNWEREPLEKLATEGQLQAYPHHGFWQPMDTLRDRNYLETLWQSGKAPLENLVNKNSFWRDRRVFLTGHTGFKGGWLALLLHRLGAQVTGYALTPETNPSLFSSARVDQVLDSRLGDLRDDIGLTRAMQDCHPEVVIHMAAQALVRRGYAAPRETYATNVMGTVNLLEAVRLCPTVRAVLVVTSDKCYDNQERARGYHENDTLGGHDPYSSSKACAELAVQSWRKSFFAPAGIAVATARAGNVIGGGDWAEDRLLPDLVRAMVAGKPVTIRHPDAIRPWQHVLEPLAGYLTLAHRLCTEEGRYATAWNFGPDDDSAWPVAKVVDRVFQLWRQGSSTLAVQNGTQSNAQHETHWLKLDASKARQELGWKPRLSLETALSWSVDWYRAYYDDPRGFARIRALTGQQIEHYLALRDGVHG